MMKPLMLAITLGVILVAAVLMPVNPARSEPDQFIISNADEVVYLSTSPSPELNSLIAGVGPRFVVEYANSIKYYGMTPISTELQNLLEQVVDRFVIQYANANRYYNLTYPLDLVGDNVPPQISNISVKGNGLVQWNTDEYTTCEVRYGTLPGIYPYIISDPLFYKLHQIMLTNLIPGTTYYYKVSCTDRSGNTTESIEQSFIASLTIYIYIPLVRR
jgi:hypothetical protein